MSFRNINQLKTIAQACNANCDGLDSNGEILDNLAMLAEAGQLSGDGTIVVDSALNEESVAPVQNRVIARLIPAEANSGNRLADKAYVDTGLAGKADADHTHDNSALEAEIANKVDKEDGKGLSTEDFTTAEKERLASLHNYDDTDLQNSVANKVDKVEGKGLSTNDFTNDYKTKLDSLENYNDVNVEIAVDEKLKNALPSKFSLNVNPVRMIAHRGMSSIAPENTLPAYEVAGDYGYWGGEVDIEKTRDGHFVCMHDSTIDRTTNGTGSVSDYTLEELKAFYIVDNKAFSGGYVVDPVAIRIPTLEEYLITCKNSALVPVIELKGSIKESDIEQILEIVKSKGLLDNSVFISFYIELLEKVHELFPRANCHLVIESFTEETVDYIAEKLSPNGAIDTYYTYVTKERVDYAHSKGIEVNCWTCDDEAKMEELIECGVDYITTNKLINTKSISHRIGSLQYELGGVDTVTEGLKELFKLSSEIDSDKIYPVSVERGSHNISYETGETRSVPYKRAIIGVSDLSSKRAIDKQKYYIKEKTLYIGGGDFEKYRITLMPFDTNGCYLFDPGWISSETFISLPDEISFVLFYFKKADGSDITDDDLSNLKSFYISKKPRIKVFALDGIITWLKGTGVIESDKSLHNILQTRGLDESGTRAMYLKAENVKGYTYIKAFSDEYKVTPHFFTRTASGRSYVSLWDFGWLTSGEEYAVPNGAERVYFSVAKKDNSSLTALDFIKIKSEIAIELY